MVKRHFRNVVVAKLQADRLQHAPAGRLRHPRVRHAATRHGAAVDLLELVAVHRIVEEEGEVREEIEPRMHEVGVHPRRRIPLASRPLRGEAVARAFAAVARIDGAEAPDPAGLDRARWNLVSRVPAGRVRHPGQGEPVAIVAVRVAQDAVHAPQLLRVPPGPVGLA